MPSWKVEVHFDAEKAEFLVDDKLNIKTVNPTPTISILELNHLVGAITTTIVFLRDNSGTKFEVTEQS